MTIREIRGTDEILPKGLNWNDFFSSNPAEFLERLPVDETLQCKMPGMIDVRIDRRD